MTTIRLDAATLDKLRTASGPVLLCDENGEPLYSAVLHPASSLDREPQFTLEQWREMVEKSPKISTDELLARIRKSRGA